MTFGEKLKQLREQAGLTQAALAKASGRGLGAIRDYEQGNRSPSLIAAFKIAAALGVSVEFFAECVEEDESEGKIVYTSEATEESKDKEETDPRWNILKKLK